MTGTMKQDLFTLVEKHPFRKRQLVAKGTSVSIRASFLPVKTQKPSDYSNGRLWYPILRRGTFVS